MTHRKPLGSTTGMMYFDWVGPAPRLGDCLMSQAGTAYTIVGEEESTRSGKIRVMLERIAVPTPGAKIHHFTWYERKRKAAV